MWRAPEAVYDKKDKKSGPETLIEPWDDGEREMSHRDHYPSAKSHMEKVKEHVLEDVNKGWMKRMEEAQDRYKEELQVASLGAAPKDRGWSDVRVVHDGAHGNKMTFPQYDDQRPL